MTQALPILYSFRRCPYAMRARLALADTSQLFEIREISLRDKPAHMLELSPKGTVPVLLLPDGTVLDESMDVMRWAAMLNDPDTPDANPANDDELIALNDGTFKHHLDRYKYADRYEDTVAQEHRSACMKYIDQLEKRLSAHKWLGGDKPKMVDWAVLPFIRQFRSADKDWFDQQRQIPHVQKWLHDFLSSKHLDAIMQKYDIWRDGDKPIMFPQQ